MNYVTSCVYLVIIIAKSVAKVKGIIGVWLHLVGAGAGWKWGGDACVARGVGSGLIFPTFSPTLTFCDLPHIPTVQ